MNPADDSAESMSRPAVGDVEGSERPESDSYSRASQDVEPETTSPATVGLEQDNTPSNALVVWRPGFVLSLTFLPVSCKGSIGFCILCVSFGWNPFFPGFV